MVKNKVVSELNKIEKEIKNYELKETLDNIENHRNFNLGLIFGLLFAIVGGFFSIIFHEIFIEPLSIGLKLIIVFVSALIMVVLLIIGISENKKLELIKKRKSNLG